MKKFNEYYYKFDTRYNDKRKIREANLFKSNELNESTHEIKEVRIPNINNNAKK
jgi:hypothetical protein